MLFNLSSAGGGGSGGGAGAGGGGGAADHLLDNMSTTGSIISTASMTNGVVNGGGAANGMHLNGMQTLPHVRNGGSATAGVDGPAAAAAAAAGAVVNGNSTLESPKHHTNGTDSVVSGSTTNGTSGVVVSNSGSAAGSATNGAVKPKTMVATPEQVMKLYMNKLTPYEHHEIFNYPQIYFIGANAKKRPGIIGAPNNCQYDDDQGSYTHIPHDHLAYRYEVLKVIGKGSFGQVVKAYDHKNHHHVALKMVRNEKRFHRQAQEEIRILEHLRKQDKDNTHNIIHLFDHFTFRKVSSAHARLPSSHSHSF